MSDTARCFEYDVFLSHNQEDGSKQLSAKLHDAGVRAWHDGDADMSDRKVQAKVGVALRDSRFVCVCVGRGFRDSKWVQYEYRRAQYAEHMSKVPRVIVALMDAEAQCSEPLSSHPRFETFRDDGFRALAQTVVDANSAYEPSAAALQNYLRTSGLYEDVYGAELTGAERTKLWSEEAEVSFARQDEHAGEMTLSLAELNSMHFDEEGLETAVRVLEMIERLTKAPLAVRQRFLGSAEADAFSFLGQRSRTGARGVASFAVLRNRAERVFTALAQDIAVTHVYWSDDPDQRRRRRRLEAHKQFAKDLCRGVSFEKASQKLTKNSPPPKYPR